MSVKKMTSKEIARLAGVSVSTVSIILNGKPGVSVETRTRVMDILEQNGISHNKRNPVALKGGVIRFCKVVKHGQIVNDRHNVFISDYVDGIIEEAKLHGLSVEIEIFNGTPMRAIAENISASHNLTGCIILATEFSQEDADEFDIGRLSVSVLLDRIKGRDAYQSRKSVLAGKLIVRQSTGPVRKKDSISAP